MQAVREARPMRRAAAGKDPPAYGTGIRLTFARFARLLFALLLRPLVAAAPATAAAESSRCSLGHRANVLVDPGGHVVRAHRRVREGAALVRSDVGAACEDE